MSRGGRWNTDITNPPTARRGRWANIEIAGPRASSNSDDHELTTSSMFDWALSEWKSGSKDAGPNEALIDLSGMDREEKLIKAFQDAVYGDGGMQYYDRLRDEHARNAITWAAAAGWAHMLGVFHRLMDLMANVIERGSGSDEPVMRKAAEKYANSLSRMVRKFVKLSNGEWQPERLPEHISKWGKMQRLTGEPLTDIDRLWLNKLFQDALKSQQKKQRRTSSPQGKFADYVLSFVIGYAAANARLNGKKLILFGIEWKTPKTEDEFKLMRDSLMRVSAEHFHVLADLLAEDEQAKNAEKVRALERPADRFRYWHESQMDEAFRAQFGLSKPRKKATPKKRAKHLKMKKKKPE